jgi:hypothetical protein
MKARILLLPVLAVAGVGASYALANGGEPHHGAFQATTTAGSCQRAHLRGAAASPQTFVVTVTKAGDNNAVAPGQVVTVSVGQAGQTVAVNVEGCLTGPSALAAREAELHGFSTVTTSTTGTTTGGHGDGDGDHHGHQHHGHKPPNGTTTGTTTTTGSGG